MQTPIASAEFAAVDFESAGARRGGTDHPVQVGWAIMRGLEIDAGDFFRSYLKPEGPITWAAQKAHGITAADLGGAPPLLTLWPQVQGALRGRAVVAHAAGTERRFLRAFPFHGFGPWVDTLRVAQAAFPDLDCHALGPLTDALGLKAEADALCEGLAWHDALYDSVASLLVLRHTVRALGIGHLPVAALLRPDAAEYYRLRAQRGEH